MAFCNPAQLQSQMQQQPAPGGNPGLSQTGTAGPAPQPTPVQGLAFGGVRQTGQAQSGAKPQVMGRPQMAQRPANPTLNYLSASPRKPGFAPA